MNSAIIHPSLLVDGLTYAAYRSLTNRLVAEGRTTGASQSTALIEYTRMNEVRMARLDRTTELLPEVRAALQQLTTPQRWVVLTEAWCGDAAQSLPVINQFAQAQPLIELVLLLRDEHTDLMDRYLTRGTRSIPKVIATDATGQVEYFTWGARPAEAQAIIDEAKMETVGLPPEEAKARMDSAKVDLQKWYARDKTRSIQVELAALLLPG